MLTLARQRFWLFSFLIAINLGLTASGRSAGQQVPVTPSDAAITALAKSLVDPIRKAKAKSVIVFDLTASNGNPHPVGKWIADRLTLAISSQIPTIKLIDRSALTELNPASDTPASRHLIHVARMEEARSRGADVAITGDFAGDGSRIGVSLDVDRTSDTSITYAVRRGVVPISKELTEITTESIPSFELEDGVPEAGEGGVSMPVCISCGAAIRIAGEVGTVKLKVVVTEDGRPSRIKVTETPSSKMAQAAIQAIRGWRFKPAIGLDGRPIAVVVSVEIESPR